MVMLLSTRCAVCDALGEVICPGCERALAPAPPLAPPLQLDTCRALLAYDDATRPLLTRLKNRDRRDLVAWLAERLSRLDAPVGSVVTWAPTSAPRRRRRGFDQGELLARALARRRDLPVHELLRRAPGAPQSGRTALERREHPGFAVLRPCPPCVILVDDVATTGTTLTAAARALRDAGAQEVHGLVVARAPLPGRSSTPT